MRSVFYILCVCAAFAVSCNDHSLAISAETQHLIDLDKIDTYLAQNGITAQQHESGLRYVVLEPGTGDRPGPDKCIKTNFKLWFLGESTLFSELADYRSPLNQNILGWRIGMKEVQSGGKIMLYVPSNLAYGPNGDRRNPQSIIPANQILVYEVELLGVTKYNSAGAYCESWP